MTTKSSIFHSVIFFLLFLAMVFADWWLPQSEQHIVQPLEQVSGEEKLEEQQHSFVSEQQVPVAIVEDLQLHAQKGKNIEKHQWFKTANMAERLFIIEEITSKLYADSDYIRLAKFIDQLDSVYTKSASIRFSYAAAKSKVGDIEAAISGYENLILAYPNHQSGLLNLGLLLRKQQQIEASNQVLHRAESVSAGSKLAKARSLLASNYKDLGQQELAREFYISSIEYRPNHGQVWFKLANLEAEMGLPNKVVMTTYERAVALSSTSVSVLSRAASYALRQGDYQKAIDWLSQAEALAPTNEKVRSALAWAHSEMGQYSTASHHWNWLSNHAEQKRLQLISEHLYLALNQQSRAQLKPLPNTLEGIYSQLFLAQMLNKTAPEKAQINKLLNSKSWQSRTEIRLALSSNDLAQAMQTSH